METVDRTQLIMLYENMYQLMISKDTDRQPGFGGSIWRRLTYMEVKTDDFM